MSEGFLHINWDDFHLLRPWFLWLLLPAIAVLFIGIAGLREQVKWKRFIASHLRPYVIQKGSETKLRRIHLALFIAISIAIVGAAGPTWKRVEVPGKTLESPLVVLLDLSQSMMADDIQPNRLERAKFKINDLLDANPRARVALVGFAGTAHTIVPLTSDYKIIKSHLDGLSPDIMPYPGTNLEAALKLADTLTRVTMAPATVLLITDDFDDELFNLLQLFVRGGNASLKVMPVNTVSGAKVPALGSKVPLRDDQGNTVHSALDENILLQLESIKNIEVNRLTLDNSDMELLAKSIRTNLEFREMDEQKEDQWLDRGLWLILPFALVVLMWFRKGWVIYALIMMLGLSSCNGNFNFKDVWLTQDFQAQQYYDQGDFEQAALLFTDPIRSGNAYYKSGDYQDAIKAYSEDTTAMGAYNLGLAYYKTGNYAAAQLAFGVAAEMNPAMGDAKKNQAIMQEMATASSEASLQDAEESTPVEQGQNMENKDMEDLSGGGQEATKEDMEQERKEETVSTDIRKGKELDEVPENFESGKQDESQKVLMRQVDDDPALFLKRKFAHQVKVNNITPENNKKRW